MASDTTVQVSHIAKDFYVFLFVTSFELKIKTASRGLGLVLM